MSNPQPAQVKIEPVVKSVWVSLPVEAAFELFTAKIDRWWPLATHSVYGEDAITCVLEARARGRLYEVHKDGRQSDWGEVLAWEPPSRVVFTMHPGRERVTAQEVEVSFQAEAGGTRLTLVHREWQKLGEQALKLRQAYDGGWENVLGKYVDAARRTAMTLTKPD